MVKWITQVVFPTFHRVLFVQIMRKIWQISAEFTDKIQQKTLRDYMDFMKKIAIEEFLIQAIQKKALNQYGAAAALSAFSHSICQSTQPPSCPHCPHCPYCPHCPHCQVGAAC